MGRTVSVSAGFVVVVVCACVSAADSQTGSRRAGTQRVGASEAGNPTVQVELTNTIRAAKAKPGDLVKARTVTSLILPNQRVIPVGSKIVGHVSEVKSGAGGDSALLTIVFNRFEMKKGENAPARFLILSAAIPQRVLPQGAMHEPDERLPPAGPGAAQTANMSTGDYTNSRVSTAQPAPWMVQPVAEGSRRNGGGDLRAVERGTLIGMPGVKLRIDDESGEATFESASRKLELKSGTQLMLDVKLAEASIAAVGVQEK